MKRIKRLKNVRLHHEGTNTLILTLSVYVVLNALLFFFLKDVTLVPFYIFFGITTILAAIIVNFFRCPIRMFNGETENTVVAAADGKVVVIEEVDEPDHFHDRRLLISIFMSPLNVHANWYPVDGVVKRAEHQDGKHYKAWLPKASTDNERSLVVIETEDGREIMVRQIAGAMARRIVTYAKAGEECFIDQHMGFIKFGSRVDLYLPLDVDLKIELEQKTVGNETVIATFK